MVICAAHLLVSVFFRKFGLKIYSAVSSVHVIIMHSRIDSKNKARSLFAYNLGQKVGRCAIFTFQFNVCVSNKHKTQKLTNLMKPL